MNERKKLKKQLGDKYIFKMYLSVNEVKKLLSENPKDKHDTLFASLTVGCVKINAVVFPTSDKMLLGFDILVKDTPESEEWICYDTLSDEIKLSPRSIEQSMFDILNREVKEYGLSYTECNFEVINGKSIKAEIGRFVARCEKSKLRQFGQFFKGRYLSRRKAYSVAEQRSPKHTERQRRSGIFKGVTFLKLCYRLYSILPDFAVLMKFSMNIRSVTERKGEKWTMIQRE